MTAATYQYYDTTQSLAPLVDLMARETSYAIDTEFAKINTFRPILGLMQIRAGDHVALIDGHHPELNTLLPLVESAPELLFHACNEDLEIFYNLGLKGLSNVFDTQIALSFLGHGLQQGYQSALLQQLNIAIDKEETRSNWLARPLRSKQLDYAANDVIYLPQLAVAIKEQLQSKDLLQMAQEDCLTNANERAKPFKLESSYRECAAPEHSTYQLAQIQQLCLWRHQLAEKNNIPKTFIIKNSVIQALVQKPPQNMFQLQKFKEIPSDTMREHGKTILTLLKDVPFDHSLWPERIAKPFRFKNQTQQQAFDKKLKLISDELNVPSEVIFRKKWLNGFVRNILNGADQPQQFSAYLRGWRYQSVVLPLAKLLWG